MKKLFLLETIKFLSNANQIEAKVKIVVLILGLIAIVLLFIYLAYLIFKKK